MDEDTIIRVMKGNLGESILEIEDRRGTTFLWVFTAECSGYQVGDYFKDDKGILCSVSSIRESQYPNEEEIIRGVIAALKDTIQKLKAKPELKDAQYKYVCVKLETECDNIEQVIKAVLDRTL